MNKFKSKHTFSMDSHEAQLLCAEFGYTNVENALAFVADQRNPVGLRVIIRPTAEMIRDILEAMHGRLGVGHIRCVGKKVFYHFPDELDQLEVRDSAG